MVFVVVVVVSFGRSSAFGRQLSAAGCQLSATATTTTEGPASREGTQGRRGRAAFAEASAPGDTIARTILWCLHLLGSLSPVWGCGCWPFFVCFVPWCEAACVVVVVVPPDGRRVNVVVSVYRPAAGGG
jgi:hypothetical protein